MRLLLASLAFLASAAFAGTVGDPYTGTPIAINGTPGSVTIIEAENFDKGGEGIAYHDPHSCSAPPAGTTCSCPPGAYRPDGVNVCVAGAITHISYDDAGLWVNYSLWVNATAAYTVELLVGIGDAACCGAAAYHLEVNGAPVLDPVTNKVASIALGPTATAGWLGFEWRGKSPPFAMAPGLHTLRVVVDKGWFNWDALRVKYAQDATVIWNGYNWVPVMRAF